MNFFSDLTVSFIFRKLSNSSFFLPLTPEIEYPIVSDICFTVKSRYDNLTILIILLTISLSAVVNFTLP